MAIASSGVAPLLLPLPLPRARLSFFNAVERVIWFHTPPFLLPLPATQANGLCDNLITCIIRAWDFRKPLLVAPAMNTHMWDSPFTRRHLAALQELGVRVLPPVSKVIRTWLGCVLVSLNDVRA